jgi:hydrogenase maturation protease
VPGPGHRFYFAPDEVEPIVPSKRILIAGIGNIFFGDDAFGVEVIRHLLARPWPEGVVIKDFGIRGYDLACALQDGYDAVILVDALSEGQAPERFT